MKHPYKILKHGNIVESKRPGKYAGCRTTGIFGRVYDACARGFAMDKANRVFFHSLEDAIAEGYRPCKACKPMNDTDFETVRHLVPFTSLAEFSDTRPKRRTPFSFTYLSSHPSTTRASKGAGAKRPKPLCITPHPSVAGGN